MASTDDPGYISPMMRRALQPARPSITAATRILEEDIGLPTIVEALEFATFTDSPDDPPSRERQLLERMNDPGLAFSGGRPVAITTHMKAVGLLLPEVLDLIRKRDVALAVANSGRHLGPVLEGLGEFAQPRWTICPICSGDGELAGDEEDDPPMPCPNDECQSGKVRVMGNLEAAKLFLETQGLRSGGKGGGVQVNLDVKQQQNNLPGAAQDRKAQQQESVTSRVQQALESGGQDK